MIPIGDENHTVRTPIVTFLLLGALAVIWLFVQGAGFDQTRLIASVCNLGLVPGELTHRAKLGEAVMLSQTMACVVDRESINVLTPLTSMFLHGGWGHLLGNALYLWIFGNNVEDSMGRMRFLVFYLLCGLVAAAAQIAIDPASPVPMVGASGAIAGVLGGYLVLYPRAKVRMLFIFIIFFHVFRVPAFLVLLFWIGTQILLGLPQLTGLAGDVSGGVAVWAHIGGFAAGLVFVKFFARADYVAQHRAMGRRIRYAG